MLTATLGWRAIFFINVPIGLAGIWITVRHARETPRAPGRGVDLSGQAAAIVTLTALAAATIKGGSRGFAAPPVLGGFALAALSAVAFVLTEARRARPMLPLRLFQSAAFSSSTVIGVLVNIAFYGLIFVFSLFFQRQQHLSALRPGLAFAPMTVAIMAANVTAGRLARNLGLRQIMAAGALLMVWPACTWPWSSRPPSACWPPGRPPWPEAAPVSTGTHSRRVSSALADVARADP